MFRQANAFLGNLVRLAFVGLLGGGGYVGWKAWNDHAEAERARAELKLKQAEIDKLNVELASTRKERDRLALANRLLKIDRRVARVLVLEQTPATAGGRAKTKVRFEEVDRDGNPVGSPKELTIDGDVLYVDSWLVKFEDLFVEQGDPLRSCSLVLFRRLFGEHQAPSDGVAVDAPGARPAAYGGAGGVEPIEEEVWRRFWEFANDPKAAQKFGIRAAHGEAVSMKLKAGGLYTITLRASGGLTFQPDGPASGSN
jgi:hypothetical protein